MPKPEEGGGPSYGESLCTVHRLIQNKLSYSWGHCLIWTPSLCLNLIQNKLV